MYRREKVGFVFQFYNLIGNLTALENVEFAASVSPQHLDPAETLEAVGLKERANNFPSQLSGGEQQPGVHSPRRGQESAAAPVRRADRRA